VHAAIFENDSQEIFADKVDLGDKEVANRHSILHSESFSIPDNDTVAFRPDSGEVVLLKGEADISVHSRLIDFDEFDLNVVVQGVVDAHVSLAVHSDEVVVLLNVLYVLDRCIEGLAFIKDGSFV
jgi:hypothetical protein